MTRADFLTAAPATACAARSTGIIPVASGTGSRPARIPRGLIE